MVDKLLNGTLATEHGNLRLPNAPDSRHHCYYAPLQEEGLKVQRRSSVLAITGARVNSGLCGLSVDWELKAAPTPFDSFSDLLAEFGLGQQKSEQAYFEVIADGVAFIDLSSEVRDQKAVIAIRGATGLDKSKFAVGYRLVERQRVVARSTIAGSEFRWDERDGLMHGEAELNIASGEALHCIANYEGIAQHHIWLSDPTHIPNIHRLAYEAFDSKLSLMNEIFDSAEGRGYQAREMEAAVAWMLSLHGFIVMHIGGTQKVQIPGPDIMAITPRTGNIVIVECTTKHLGSDKKLPDLVSNAEKLRRKLEAAGQSDKTILKVLVTTLRSEDIAAERSDAERLGVLVLTREKIESVLNESSTTPDAERMFADAVESVQSALATAQGKSAIYT